VADLRSCCLESFLAILILEVWRRPGHLVSCTQLQWHWCTSTFGVFCGLPSASGPLSCLSLAWVPPCFRTWAARRCGTSCTIWATSACREASCLYSHSLIPAQTLFPGWLIYTSAYCHFNCFSFKTWSSWWAFSPGNPLNILSGVSRQGCSLLPSPGPASCACDLYSHARPHTQKVSLWFNVLLLLPWNS